MKEKKKDGKPVGARTVEAELAVALRVLRWAKDAGYAIDETAFGVEPPKVKVSRIRRYDPVMFGRLLDAARKGPEPSTKKHGRKSPAALARVAALDVLAIETLRLLGLRAGELRAFAVDWIRWAERRVVVPHDASYSPKGGRTRSIPLESTLAALLRRHLGERTEGRVFEPARAGRPAKRGEKRKAHYRGRGIDVQKLVGRVAAAAGVDLTAHDLRHYCISRWVDLMPQARHSLAEVQEWAGHASIRTTELYSHTAGGRWRSHAEGLDEAARDSERDSGSSQGHLRAVR
jgi:integrase